jgi:hypothetical protein
VVRLAPLLALVLAGCGSAAVADLPAPAEPPRSPALTERPAGRVEPGPFARSGSAAAAGAFGVDRARDRVLAPTGASAPTCREPVAAATLDRGARVAVLCGRERMLDIHDARTLERLGRASAGIGPAGLATDGVEILYVTDVLGDALLVYHLRPFELIRRVHLGGAPYAIAYDRDRWGLWITLNGVNRLVHYSAGNRPVIREEFPSIRDAREIFVGDDVVVLGEDERQILSR